MCTYIKTTKTHKVDSMRPFETSTDYLAINRREIKLSSCHPGRYKLLISCNAADYVLPEISELKKIPDYKIIKLSKLGFVNGAIFSDIYKELPRHYLLPIITDEIFEESLYHSLHANISQNSWVIIGSIPKFNSDETPILYKVRKGGKNEFELGICIACSFDFFHSNSSWLFKK